MAKISTYPLDGDPKLSDKLIGTSSGYSEDGELLNPTYNFSLQQLLDLFLPVIPSNNLQGVLDYGNTATQDINLFGKITTTNLEVTDISTLFSAYISDSLYLSGVLFDKNNFQGTEGQILISTEDGVQWFTPIVTIPTLQEVLTSGHIADVDILLSANINLEGLEAKTVFVQDGIEIAGTLTDSNESVGTLGQALISLGSAVEWQDIPVYTATSPLFVNPSTKDISIQQANSTQNGYLSFTDWINFDGKQNALSGTGIVVSNGGTITYITNNSANWNQAYNDSIVSASVSGATSKTLTLTQRDGDVITTTWSDEGIGSIGLSMPAAFIVTNSPLTSDGVIEVQAAGTALEYIKGDGTLGTFPAVTGFVPYTGATQDVDLGSNDITANAIIKSGGTSGQFLKADGSVDSNSYITLLSLLATSPLIYNNTTGTFSIQQANASQGGYLSSTDWSTFNSKQTAGNYITGLNGEASASGPGTASVVLNNAAVISKVLTGLNVTGGTVVSTDTILQAFGKLQNQVNGLVGGTIYQGTWNASTNTPTLASNVGTNGYYYIVNVAGSTNLNGITDWKVGDWAIFNGGTWQKVDNTDSVVSVNGYTGAVNLVSSDIPEGLTNLYFTDARARAALSFSAGSGAYNSTTGVITIPTNTNQLTNGSSFITLASLSGTAPIGYNNATGVISITQATTSTNGYLSSTDWNTFNNKQNAIGYTPANDTLVVHLAGTETITGVKTFTATPYLDNNIYLKKTGSWSNPANYSVIGGMTNGFFLSSDINKHAYLDLSALTQAQSFAFPNASGTFALTSDLTNKIGGSGTTNYLSKFTGSGTLGNSLIYDNGTNIGIGTTSPNTKLVVDGGSSDYTPIWAKSSLSVSSKYYGSLLAGYALTSNRSAQFGYVYDTVTPANSFAHITPYGSAEGSKFMVRADGNVGIGTTSPSSKFDVVGSSWVSNLIADDAVGNSIFIRFNTSVTSNIGSITRAGSTSAVLYNTTSDYRLKEDFKNYSGLDLISNINTYDFKWKNSEDRMYGVIAHELQEVVPYAVNGEKDAEQMQQVDYSKLVPILVNAIKELKAEIEILKNK